MTEQEALDKLTLNAKCSNFPTMEQIIVVNSYSKKLQKLIDRQKKEKPIHIHIKDNEDYTYCRRCSTKVIKKYRFCYKCGTEIDWR